RVAPTPLWSHLLPRALRRILVRTEAEEPRAVPEAVALHLVVAHLDDQLGPDGGFLEPARSPAVLLGEAALGSPFEERPDEGQDHGLPTRRDGARPDVVEATVVLVESKQQRRERGRLRLPAHADDDAVRRPVLLHLRDRVTRARQVG